MTWYHGRSSAGWAIDAAECTRSVGRSGTLDKAEIRAALQQANKSDDEIARLLSTIVQDELGLKEFQALPDDIQAPRKHVLGNMSVRMRVLLSVPKLMLTHVSTPLSAHVSMRAGVSTHVFAHMLVHRHTCLHTCQQSCRHMPTRS